MNTANWSLGRLILLVPGPWRRKKPVGKVRKRSYGAVAIVTGSGAFCEEAGRIAGLRFLPAAAPPLPVPGCSAASCRCRYERFADRRDGDVRRSADLGLPQRARRGLERRGAGTGRRATETTG